MLVVTSCDYYHLSFRTQEPFSPNPLRLGVLFSVSKSSNTLHRFTSAKPAGAWDGTKAVPVTVMGEIGALNAKTGFTHLGHSGEGSYYYIDFTPYTQGVYFIYTSIGIYAQFSIVIKTNNAISLLLQSSSSTSVENNNTLKQHTSAWYGNVYIKKLLK